MQQMEKLLQSFIAMENQEESKDPMTSSRTEPSQPLLQAQQPQSQPTISLTAQPASLTHEEIYGASQPPRPEQGHQYVDHCRGTRHYDRRISKHPLAFTPSDRYKNPQTPANLRHMLHEFMRHLRVYGFIWLTGGNARKDDKYEYDCDVVMVQQLYKASGLFATYIEDCVKLPEAIEILRKHEDMITETSRQNVLLKTQALSLKACNYDLAKFELQVAKLMKELERQ